MSTASKIAIMIVLAMASDAAWAWEHTCIESITPNPACLGTEMTFKAGSTCTYGGTPRWDFDDGQTAEGMTVTHTYSNINGYLVTLKVTDTEDCGHTATAAQWVAVAGVAKLSAGGVESYTDTPGEAETLYVAKGSGDVTITASPLLWWFSWPTGQPQWTGGTAVPGHPEQRKVATDTETKYTISAQCGDSSKAINITVYSMAFKSVSFSGSKYHMVKKDDGPGDFDAPHWQDNSDPPDGDADDPCDRKYPVCYQSSGATLDSFLTADVDIQVKPENAFPAAVWRIKADGGQSGPVLLEGAGSVSGTTLSFSGGPQPYVTAFEQYQATAMNAGFRWSISRDNGLSWDVVGNTSNDVYVTYKAPSGDLYQTVLAVSCGAAAGKGGDANKDDAVFEGIWDAVKGLDVHRASDNAQLTYYANWRTPNTDLASLMEKCDSECGPWAYFLMEMAKAQGVANPGSFETFEPSGKAFIVKNWTYTGSQTSDNQDWPCWNIYPANGDCINSAGNAYVWSYAEVNDQTGVQGQSNQNPKSLFNRHFVVLRNGNYYDPSYGATYTSSNQFFQNAISGYASSNRVLRIVSEQAINTDLNGDGDKADLVVRYVRYFRTQP